MVANHASFNHNATPLIPNIAKLFTLIYSTALFSHFFRISFDLALAGTSSIKLDSVRGSLSPYGVGVPPFGFFRRHYMSKHDRYISGDRVVEYFEAMADLQHMPRIRIGYRSVIDARGFEISDVHLDIAQNMDYTLLTEINGYPELKNIQWKFEDSYILGQLEKYGFKVREYARLIGDAILEPL